MSNSLLKSRETHKRWSPFPIVHDDLWKKVKEHEAQLWVAQEIDLSDDRFDELTPSQQHYLKNLLAFFTISDGIVMENLSTNFLSEAEILEAQYYYGIQNYIEGVHAELYGLFVDKYIKDRSEQLSMYNAITEIETVKKKAQWALNWIGHPSFIHRLVAFACVEGLAFSSTFAGIFYFRKMNVMPGLCAGNEFIMRDENMHAGFAIYLYNNYVKDEDKLPIEDIKKIILECYEVEKTFVEESIPDGLPSLTKDDMLTYVKFVTDTLLINFGLESEFGVRNPLSYMDRIAMPRKTNFFEKRNGEYTRVEIPSDKKDMFDEDF